MKKLVVVADDYGLCESVNKGIVESHLNGIVTELSLMLGSPGTEHALRLVQDHHIQNVGIHMLLKNWRDTGALVRRPDYAKLFAEAGQDEITRLVNAEFAEFEQTIGHKPSHITSQYGIISNPKALPAVAAYAAEHHIPMRQPKSVDHLHERDPNSPGMRYIRSLGIRTTDVFLAHIDDVETARDAKAAFERDLAALPDQSSAEICLHPGHIDAKLRSLTSLVDERARDLKLALDPTFQTWLKHQNIALVPFANI